MKKVCVFFQHKRRKKYTKQVILYTSVAVIIVVFISFLGLHIYQEMVNKIFSDVMEKQEFAAVYEDAGQMKEAIEEYLETGDEQTLWKFRRIREKVTEKMGEGFSVFLKNASDMEDAVQRKNLAGIFLGFDAASGEVIEAKQRGDIETYLNHYEEMLDRYREMDLYIKEIMSDQLIEQAHQYETLQRQMRKRYLIVVIMVMLVTILVLILLTTHSVEMTRPILRLSEYVKRMEEGDFNFEIEEETSSEEIQILYASFANMKDGIRKKQELEKMLIEQKIDNLKMRNALKEAELKTLQAQINPHFLFNTINTGAQMATLHDDDATAEYFYHVADLFRYNIKDFEKESTLQEELDYTRNYIHLMEVRFGSKYQFCYKNSLDEKAGRLKVPKMILQPVVENAYTHGVRKNEDGGKIELAAEQDERYIYIYVRDNGPGLREEEIEQILSGKMKKDSRPQREGSGIGLGNVIERMRLWYKMDEVMKISRKDGVTEFTLVLPIDR